MDSKFKQLSAFGGLPGELPLPDAGPSAVLFAEWPWLRPLKAILDFSHWTIDDVVSSPRAAAEVRLLWKAYRMGQRIAREREAKSLLSEQIWRRRHGCPISCPICGSLAACGCEVASSQS